jgi:hypothetical protein
MTRNDLKNKNKQLHDALRKAVISAPRESSVPGDPAVYCKLCGGSWFVSDPHEGHEEDCLAYPEYDFNELEKCSRDGWCPAMRHALENSEANRKGLSPVVLTRIETLENYVVGVAYKRDKKDKGLLFNVCPWCGVDINFVRTQT